MLLALGVREVVALIVMESEAKLALVCTQVILHEIGVFAQVNHF